MPRGVRLNPAHDERTRAKIQTSQIINRLGKFVKSSPGAKDWSTAEMTPSQVTAALGLIKKTLPDLATVTHQGDDEKPFALTVTWVGD